MRYVTGKFTPMRLPNCAESIRCPKSDLTVNTEIRYLITKRAAELKFYSDPLSTAGVFEQRVLRRRSKSSNLKDMQGIGFEIFQALKS